MNRRSFFLSHVFAGHGKVNPGRGESSIAYSPRMSLKEDRQQPRLRGFRVRTCASHTKVHQPPAEVTAVSVPNPATDPTAAVVIGAVRCDGVPDWHGRGCDGP